MSALLIYEDPTAVLDRVSVHPCFSLERDMPGILDVISTRLYEPLESATRPGVIVIDPVTDLFRNVLNNASSQGTSTSHCTLPANAGRSCSDGDATRGSGRLNVYSWSSDSGGLRQHVLILILHASSSTQPYHRCRRTLALSSQTPA